MAAVTKAGSNPPPKRPIDTTGPADDNLLPLLSQFLLDDLGQFFGALLQHGDPFLIIFPPLLERYQDLLLFFLLFGYLLFLFRDRLRQILYFRGNYLQSFFFLGGLAVFPVDYVD